MMKKMKPAVMVIAVLVILALCGFFLFRRAGGSSDRVVYVTPVSGGAGDYLSDRYGGVVEAQASVDYKKDPEKKVLEIYVEEGEEVNSGDQLFRYDTEKAENDIASARLDLEGFDNEISALNEEINELVSQRDEASDSEKLDYTTEIQSKQMQIRQKQYEKQIKESDIKKLQNEIDHSVVRSTISGVVKHINEDESSDKPFMSVTQTGQFRIKGSLNEQAVMKITAGQAVIVRSRVNETEVWKGVITQIETEPSSDSEQNMYSSGEKSSNYPFYVSLESTEGLMLGQHVFIEPDFGQAAVTDGIWLDAGYIVTEENGKTYVWIADSHDRLKKKQITVGTFDENTLMYEITDGLSKDDRIAWPDDTLREGLPVTAAEAAAEEEPA